MKQIKKMSQVELAALIQARLSKAGIISGVPRWSAFGWGGACKSD